jgi:predicted nucleic acid-binding protein
MRDPARPRQQTGSERPAHSVGWVGWVIDLLTAAVAEYHGAVILHYDADFEHIASVTGQAHKWIVPQGAVS